MVKWWTKWAGRGFLWIRITVCLGEGMRGAW